MSKKHLSLLTPMVLSLVLASACADQGDGNGAAEQAPQAAKQSIGNGAADNSPGGQASLMDQPVDFSTPENAEKHLQKIRAEAGEKQYRKIDSAIKYMLFYDLSVGQDKAKLYAKLDGKTPNEILAMMKR